MDEKTYCIYIRCSTEDQIEGYSLEIQKSRCMKFINAIPNAVYYDTYADEGISATDPLEKRKGLMRLLLDAQDNKFDCIIILASDRLIRMSEHDQYIFYALMKYDIEVRTCSNELLTDNSPMGEFMRKIRIAISELEVKLLSFRVKGAMQVKAEKGEFKGGQLVYGVIHWDKENQKMIFDEKKIEQIKLIYDLYVNKLRGMTTIRDILNNSDNLYIDKNNEETLWNKDRIGGVLNTPMYCGYHYHNTKYSKFDIHEDNTKFKDKSEWQLYPINYIKPIISKEMWDKAQEIKDKRGKKIISSIPNKTTWLLTGMLYCGCCGTPMQGHPIINKKKLKNGEIAEYDCSDYICIGRTSKGGKYCKAKHIVKKKIEKIVYEKVLKYLNDLIEKLDKILNEQKAIKNLINQENEVDTKEIDHINKEINKINKKIDKYYKDYENEEITAKVLTPAINRLNQEKEKLESKLFELNKIINKNDNTNEELKNYLDKLKEWEKDFKSDDIVIKKMALQKLVDYIEVIGNPIRNGKDRLRIVFYSDGICNEEYFPTPKHSQTHMLNNDNLSDRAIKILNKII